MKKCKYCNVYLSAVGNFNNSIIYTHAYKIIYTALTESRVLQENHNGTILQDSQDNKLKLQLSEMATM